MESNHSISPKLAIAAVLGVSSILLIVSLALGYLALLAFSSTSLWWLAAITPPLVMMAGVVRWLTTRPWRTIASKMDANQQEEETGD